MGEERAHCAEREVFTGALEPSLHVDHWMVMGRDLPPSCLPLLIRYQKMTKPKKTESKLKLHAFCSAALTYLYLSNCLESLSSNPIAIDLEKHGLDYKYIVFDVLCLILGD